MSNALYDKGREAFLTGAINWSSDTIKVVGVTSSYTPNLSTHQFHSDLGANIVFTSGALGTKTTTAGVADAADITISAVSGSAVQYLAIYKDTTVSGTSPLIALLDTATVNGSGNLPFTPNGGDVQITWDSGANKIFKL